MDLLSTTLESDVRSLASALRRVQADAQAALDRMAAGTRPSSSVSHSSPIDIRDVEKYAARVDMLLNWAGSPYMPEKAALDALRIGVIRRPGE